MATTAQGHKWMGSSDPAELSGEAVFRVGGHCVETTLPSFADFNAICNLLEASRRIGETEGVSRVRATVRKAIGDV